MKLPTAHRISTYLLLMGAVVMISFQGCDKSPEDHSDIKESIISIMEKTRADMEAPGYIVGIRTKSAYHKYAGGKAVLAPEVPMHTTDFIRIGSITKTFTATLALILCDEGVLSLDDKLVDHFPEFSNAESIQLRHLLNHTAGLVTWDEDEEIRMQIYYGTGNWTIDKLIQWASSQDLLSEPGTKFHYSNIGYFLLGKIIEAETGQDLGDLIETKICYPLNLQNTFMADVPSPVGESIHGYDGAGGTLTDMTGTPQADAINFELAWSAGGMFSTVDDLVSWSKALTRGTLLSTGMHETQLPVLKPPSPAVPYWSGYGMGIDQIDAWMGHTGAVSGFICYMQRYPEEDITIITFFNKFSAFDLEANTADVTATADNFVQLARLMAPETLGD